MPGVPASMSHRANKLVRGMLLATFTDLSVCGQLHPSAYMALTGTGC